MNSNMKLILLLYISKYYENRIIAIKYLSSLVNLIETIVSKELEKLGYIKSEMVTYKNITSKIEWTSYYKKNIITIKMNIVLK